MFKFVGIGSCFNSKCGNTAAYILNSAEHSLFLIDCGETVFSELDKRGMLKGLKEITVLVTHLHSDHIGSLPSLIFYASFLLGIMVTIIFPDKKDLAEKVLFTVDSEKYAIYTPEEYNAGNGKYRFTALKQMHSANINAYGYEIEIEDKKIYYSGDTHILPETVLEKFLAGEYDAFYHEVTRYKNGVHHHIDTLKAEIPEAKRGAVTCIHLDDDETIKLAEEAGFCVPAFS